MTQPEARLSRLIMKRIRDDYGYRLWCFKVHGSEYQPAGIPDILGCLDGQMFGIETKMPGNQQSEIQRYRARKMRDAGAYVAVCYSVDEAVAFLQRLEQR